MTDQQPETDAPGADKTGNPEVPETEDEAPEFTDDDGVAGDDEGSDDE